MASKTFIIAKSLYINSTILLYNIIFYSVENAFNVCQLNCNSIQFYIYTVFKNLLPETFYYNFIIIALMSITIGTYNLHMT